MRYFDRWEVEFQPVEFIVGALNELVDNLNKLEEKIMAWEDVDIENSTINLVILKQRGKRKGLVKSIPMLDKTKKLFLKLRPHDFSLKEPIFHIKAKSMSTDFTKFVKSAGIKGLSLHDLRTEGISRMLEMGLTIPIVA